MLCDSCSPSVTSKIVFACLLALKAYLRPAVGVRDSALQRLVHAEHQLSLGLIAALASFLCSGSVLKQCLWSPAKPPSSGPHPLAQLQLLVSVIQERELWASMDLCHKPETSDSGTQSFTPSFTLVTICMTLMAPAYDTQL